MGKLHDQNPSEFNVNDYRYFKPVAKVDLSKNVNTPAPKPNTMHNVFPPVGSLARKGA